MEQKRRNIFIIPTELEKMRVKGNYLPEILSTINKIQVTIGKQNHERANVYHEHFEKINYLLNHEKEVEVSINTDGEILIISIKSFWPK